MTNKAFAYIRVSTKEQNEARQLIAIKDYCKDNNINLEDRDIYIDKASGKDFNRESYKALKHNLRAGDTLIIKELDRLGRDMQGIKEQWQELTKKGIDIIVIDNEILSTKGKSDLEQQLISNIVFELLSYMAEKERIKIKARQAEGIANAKANGKHLGRPATGLNTLSDKQLDILKENFLKFNKARKDREITAEEFMDKLGLKRNTFYKVINQYKDSLTWAGQ